MASTTDLGCSDDDMPRPAPGLVQQRLLPVPTKAIPWAGKGWTPFRTDLCDYVYDKTLFAACEQLEGTYHQLLAQFMWNSHRKYNGIRERRLFCQKVAGAVHAVVTDEIERGRRELIGTATPLLTQPFWPPPALSAADEAAYHEFMGRGEHAKASQATLLSLPDQYLGQLMPVEIETEEVSPEPTPTPLFSLFENQPEWKEVLDWLADNEDDE